MKQNFAFSDMFKNADAFKNALDFNQLFSSQRRNIEALSEVHQIGVESAQTISRRNAEIARENVETAIKASKEMMTGGASSEASISKNTKAARAFFENSLNNLREMTEMVTKTGFEAFDVLNKRAAESFEEISSASAKAAPTAAKKSSK